MTTQDDIRGWFERGVNDKAMFMFVICDMFDWDDYPAYYYSVENALVRKNKYVEMEKIMEIYDLREPMEPQLNKPRNFAELK